MTTARAVLTGLAAVACLAASQAQASSPQSWDRLRSRSEAACIQASGFRDARMTAYADSFAASTVAVIEGTWPQRHMKNMKGRVFCLFDKQSGRVEVAEPLAAGKSLIQPLSERP